MCHSLRRCDHGLSTDGETLSSASTQIDQEDLAGLGFEQNVIGLIISAQQEDSQFKDGQPKTLVNALDEVRIHP